MRDRHIMEAHAGVTVILSATTALKFPAKPARGLAITTEGQHLRNPRARRRSLTCTIMG